MSDLEVVNPTTSVPAGATLIAMWPIVPPFGIGFPDAEELLAAVAEFGVGVVFDWMPKEHVAVKLAADTVAGAVGGKLTAAANGYPPSLFLVPSLSENVGDPDVGLVEKFAELKNSGGGGVVSGGGVTEVIEDLIDTGKDKADDYVDSKTIPILIGVAVLGLGFIAIGAALYFAKHKKG